MGSVIVGGLLLLSISWLTRGWCIALRRIAWWIGIRISWRIGRRLHPGSMAAGEIDEKQQTRQIVFLRSPAASK